MSRFILRITKEGVEDIISEISAPTFEMLTEKYGAWERAQTTNIIAGVDFGENGGANF